MISKFGEKNWKPTPSSKLVRWSIVRPCRRAALFTWLPKFNGALLVASTISGKIFMKIRSVLIIFLGIGRGTCSMDDFQNQMDCSLYHPQPLHKISSKSVHNLLSNPGNTWIILVTDWQTETHTHTHTHTSGAPRGVSWLPGNPPKSVKRKKNTVQW